MLAPSSKATLYSCIERQVVPVPPSEFVGPLGKVQLFKEVLSRGYFDVDFRGGEVVLVAGKFVGLIPLNDKIVVEILPKAQLTDFARMLEIAGEDPGSLSFFERGYVEKEGADQFFLLIVKSLVQQLRPIAQEGMLKAYSRRGGEHTFKPTIQFSKTLQRVWAKGNFSHSYSDVFEFTKDTPLNRLVKYALWFSGRYLVSQGKGQALAEEIELYSNLFEAVPLDLKLSFLTEVEEVVRSGQLPTARHYYLAIAKLCLMIARNRSVTLDSQGGDARLLSFIINLEDVFEKYVRNALRMFVHRERSDLLVRDGNLEGRGHLFHDSTAFSVSPDIIVVRGSEKPLIADVKYKPRTTEADRYQLISHATALGASMAISVLPASEAGNGLIRKGQLHDTKGIQVFEYHMPLTGNLVEEEKRMAAEILSLIPA
jgi:5-methylcytosine-specific restriction enzyme subunit McrC